jgi:hypothetical protein
VVARYALDGDAQDSSGNGFHGVNNGTSFIVDATRGTVASFDGTSSSISVAGSGYSITERPNFQFAISFWILPTPRQDYAPGGAIDVNPIMGATSSGVIEIVGQNSWAGMGGAGASGAIGLNSGGGAGSSALVPTINLYDGLWHHIVIQWADPDGVPSDFNLNTGQDATVWIDASLAADVNGQVYNGNGQPSPSMVLGGPLVHSNGGPADKFYAGLMSDVQFFDSQLTSQEVNNVFLGIPEPASTSLFALAAGLVLLRRKRD